MKFGVFYELQLPKPWIEGAEHRLFQEALEQIVLADKLGIDQLCVFIPTVRGIPAVDEGRENDDDEEVSRTHSG